MEEGNGNESAHVRAWKRLEDIKQNPDKHRRHTFVELEACCFVGGSSRLLLLRVAHSQHAPVRINVDGSRCDVVSGPCSCGATHLTGEKKEEYEALERLADIRNNPQAHHHTEEELMKCVTIDGEIHDILLDVHARYAPVKVNPGGKNCDVTSGFCNCGETH